MRIDTIITVGLRLITINLLVQSLVETATLAVGWFDPRAVEVHHASFGLVILTLFTAVVVSTLLWAFTPTIAKAVTVNTSPEISFGSLAVVDCYTVGFVFVGLFYAMAYVPSLATWVIYMIKSAAQNSGSEWRNGVDGAQFLKVIIWIIAGLGMTFNARKLAVALATKHGAPVPPEEAEKITAHENADSSATQEQKD